MRTQITHPLLQVPVPVSLCNYVGSKQSSQLLPHIINYIPAHSTYVELFAGSAAVGRNLRQAEKSIFNDLDPVVTSALSYVKPYGYSVVNLPADVAIVPFMLCGSDTFIYADPPYPLSSRRSGRSYYNYEMSDSDHVALLRLLLKCSCNVMLSSYPNSLYDSMLTSWVRKDFQVMTRKGKATESLYMNYPRPLELHDYSYIGHGRTHRQQLGRLATRWCSKLKSMPTLQRMAVLDNLRHEFPELL